MRRLVLVLLVLVAGCGGGDKSGPSGDDPRKTLEGVKPISSATVEASLRINLDDAPAEVGDRVELTFAGPMRANGPGKLPSLDWKIGFSSGFSSFNSRIVSTGNNVFVNLGGADFAVGEKEIARINEQAASNGGADGLAAVGLDPLAAVTGVKDAGAGEVGGEETTRYTGAIDVDRALDQIDSFLRHLPQQSTDGLTPEQREQVKTTFQSPRFEAQVADDDTIRQLLLTSRFTTPTANREAASGITGGTIEYRVDYTNVGEEVTISPVEGARPLSEFNAALQRELAK
jgi:hypothetical protein